MNDGCEHDVPWADPCDWCERPGDRARDAETAKWKRMKRLEAVAEAARAVLKYSDPKWEDALEQALSALDKGDADDSE